MPAWPRRLDATGGLVGLLAGGATCVGTAQLAYTEGLSAWWFTLGAGVGLALVAVWGRARLAGSKRADKPLPALLLDEFGPACARLATAVVVLVAIAALTVQLLAGMAVLGATTRLDGRWSILACAALAAAWAIWGRRTGARFAAVVAALVAVVVLVAGVVAASGASGWAGLPYGGYRDLVGPDFGVGTGVAALLGVVTASAVAQLVTTGRLTARGQTAGKMASRGGAPGAAAPLFAAVLVVLCGAAGVLVGLSMRTTQPDLMSALALPAFLCERLPVGLGWAMCAALLVCVVTTSAMLADRMAELLRPHRPRIGRVAPVLGLLAAGVVLAEVDAGGLMLSWSIGAICLLGCAGFAVRTAALVLPGRVGWRWAVAAVVCGALCTIVGPVVPTPALSPVWAGAGVSVVIMLVGLLVGRRRSTR